MYKVDREEFILWVKKNKPVLLIPPIEMVARSLIQGSEYIIEADDVLDRVEKIPRDLIPLQQNDGKRPEEDYVSTNECRLVYNLKTQT